MAADGVVTDAREQLRNQLVTQHQTRGVERLRRVRRCGLRTHLAPTLRVIGHDAEEQGLLVRRRAARGAERLRQWEPYAKEIDDAGGSARRGSVRASRPGHSARAYSNALRSCSAPLGRDRLACGCALRGLLRSDGLLLGRSRFGRSLLDRSLLGDGLADRRLRDLARQHGVLEVLEGCDARDALGLDLHRLTRRWVTREACGTIDPPELREAGDRNVFAARNASGDDLDERGQVHVCFFAGRSLRPANSLSSWLRFTSVLHRLLGKCGVHRYTKLRPMQGSGEDFSGFFTLEGRKTQSFPWFPTACTVPACP